MGLGASLRVTGLCLSEGLWRAGGVTGTERNLAELLQSSQSVKLDEKKGMAGQSC